MIAGIDEAGKGPVIGPLVLCGVVIKKEMEEKLKEIGVKDSKLLSTEKRKELYRKVKELVEKYHVIKINPEEIDDKTINLNELEAKKTAEIINKLEPTEITVDCPTINTKKYTEQIIKYLKTITKIKAENKADTNHIVVGAASIIAKEEREKEILLLKEKYGDFGSGYPSDPKTQKFLLENWDKCPGLFRKTWSSWKEAKAKKEQKGLMEF